jgi:predicted phage terminase large subunit-like protein
MELTIPIHPVQAAFLESSALIRLFCGGRGSGKTWIGAIDMLRGIEPGYEYGVMAPDYTMLSDIDIPELRKAAERMSIPIRFHPGSMTLETGAALIHCRSLDNPDKVRGHSWRRAWIDEGSIVPREAFDIVIGCLRSDGEQGKLSITATPKGRQHWTYDLTKRQQVECFFAGSASNPFLPASYVDLLRSQYGTMYAQQEIEGQFVDFSGGMFHRDWFKIVSAVPARLDHICRFWDMASTEKSKKNNDPDYTVGAKIGHADGVWYILDVVRGQWSPGTCEEILRQTAVLDGSHTAIRMEQEAGASGKAMIAHYAKNVFVGFDFRGVSPTGSKELRAQPLSAAAEAGNVRVLSAPWNAAMLDELELFGADCPHDDQVDSLSGAFSCIAERINYRTPTLNEHLTHRTILNYDSEIAELRKGLSPAGQIAADKLLREVAHA